jgi:hypothetical protein
MKHLKYILCFLLLALPLFAQERIPMAPDTQEETLSFFFDGAWLPDLDPALISAKNYSELKNLRYTAGGVGLEGVSGYSKINTTAIAGSYTKIRSGFQLETDDTTTSYVLVQVENTGETASGLIVNDTAIPSQGDFSSTIELDSGNEYRYDSSGAGLGRFSRAPNGHLLYCNGVECLAWAGEEMRVGAFFAQAAADPYGAAAYPKEYTEAVNNTLSTSANLATIGSTGDHDWILVLSPRPLQGLYFDLVSVNTTVVDAIAKYWKNDATWAALTEQDGTKTGGDTTLGQDGWLMWNEVSDSGLYYFNGYHLYAYRIYFAGADATIAHVKANAPLQKVVDLWDGIPRQPIKFMVWRNAEGIFEDYTLEVNEYSFKDLPYVAKLDGLTTSDYIDIMFEEQIDGISFDFIEGYVNLATSTDTTVSWFNGFNNSNGVTEFDDTDDGPAFNRDGVVWWVVPSGEFKRSKHGVIGYNYRITFQNTLSGTYRGKLSVSGTTNNTVVTITTSTAHNLGDNDIVTITGVVGTTEANGTWAVENRTATTFDLVGSTYANAYTSGGQVIREASDTMADYGDIALDVVTGITAPKTIGSFKFPVIYRNRAFLCGSLETKEANRCDYASVNTTEVWNGADSSDDGAQSLYFGSSEDLTAGHQIYNRYGSRVITMLAMFKDRETYVLQGDSPEDFTIQKVSSNIGCPAPLTLASAEVAYGTGQTKRNMLFFLTYEGPYSFDGQNMTPIGGIDKYFDPDNSDSIVLSEIENASGWYDTQEREYNLLIPTGSATLNDTWLVYDVLQKKWFRKDTGAAEFPQVGFPVTSNSSGGNYIYGGIDTGFMMRFENGDNWADTAAGEPIEQVVTTGDFWPTNDPWDLTRIRKVKVWAKSIAEDHELIVQHFSDTEDSIGFEGVWKNWSGGEWVDWNGGEWVGASTSLMSLYPSDSINRIVRDTVRADFDGWAHRFEFSVSTDETTKGFQPLGWGIVSQELDRHDE